MDKVQEYIKDTNHTHGGFPFRSYVEEYGASEDTDEDGEPDSSREW